MPAPSHHHTIAGQPGEGQILHVTQRNQRNQKRASPVLTHNPSIPYRSPPASTTQHAPLITALWVVTHTHHPSVSCQAILTGLAAPVPISVGCRHGARLPRRTDPLFPFALQLSTCAGIDGSKQLAGQNVCGTAAHREGRARHRGRRVRAPPELPPEMGGLFIKWGQRAASQRTMEAARMPRGSLASLSQRSGGCWLPSRCLSPPSTPPFQRHDDHHDRQQRLAKPDCSSPAAQPAGSNQGQRAKDPQQGSPAPPHSPCG